jgi:hypothetical protein
MTAHEKATARIEALRNAPRNSWVALSEDESRIVATAPSYAEAVKKSAEAGVEDPVLVKTPAEWLPLAV